jgi:4-amino-4-deoxy-L-arabinose transferase-like glycosyltransferase
LETVEAGAHDASLSGRGVATVGRFVERRYGMCVALVLALMAANVFWRLGAVEVSDSDEARYGVSASEMLHAHSVLVPTYGGQPTYLLGDQDVKPPLGYWLIELSFLLFGPTALALRLPSALCGLGVVALTMSTSRRWFGRRAAILSGLIMATSIGFLGHHGARSGDFDSALTLILLAALSEIPRLDEGGARPLAWSLLLSLGFLLKSFAILPLVIVAIIYLGTTGQWRRLDPRSWALAGMLFIAIVGGWALARTIADGSPAFVASMVREDLFTRATRMVNKVTYHPGDYVGSVIDRLLPWPLLVLIGWVMPGDGPRKMRPNLRLLLLTAALIPLVLFTVARTHHHWYLEPTYPAWAMLAAVSTLALMRRARGPVSNRVAAALVVVALLGGEARIIVRIVRDRMPENQVFLGSLHDRGGELGGRVCAAFPLWGSERFLLQVVNGFGVDEQAVGSSPPTTELLHDSAVLLAKQPSRMSMTWIPPRNAHIVAASGDYLIWRVEADVPLTRAAKYWMSRPRMAGQGTAIEARALASLR